MGDLSQRGGRVARAMDDLRSLRERARARRPGHEPRALPAAGAAAAPDESILRRLEAVEHALEELVLELRAGARPPDATEDHPTEPAEPGQPGVELDDPFGLLARERGSSNPDANGR